MDVESELNLYDHVEFLNHPTSNSRSESQQNATGVTNKTSGPSKKKQNKNNRKVCHSFLVDYFFYHEFFWDNNQNNQNNQFIFVFRKTELKSHKQFQNRHSPKNSHN